MSRRSCLATVLVSAAAATGWSGCGGGDADPEDKAVRQVLTDLQDASRAGNGDRICNEIFTPRLADSITRSSQSGSCATEVEENLFSPETRIEVERVTFEDEMNAASEVVEANGNRSTVFLVKQAGAWRIRGIEPA